MIIDYSKVREVVNLTPHGVRVCVGKDTVTIPPSGKTARLRVRTRPHGTVSSAKVDIPVVRSVEDEITNVPEPKDGTIFIVSSVIAKALKRDDVLSPDTTSEGVLKDGDGRVFAVKRLQCFSEEM